MVIIDVIINEVSYTIANIYAPTRAFEKEQITTLGELTKGLQSFAMENIILGGDFNVHLNPYLDKTTGMSETNDCVNYRKELLAFLNSENLVDIWRILNPSKKMFSWSRNNQKSRLDYFFISEHLINTTAMADILPCTHSDHSLLVVAFKGQVSHQSGRGFWKMNTSLLYDPIYVNEIKKIIASTASENRQLDDKSLVWDITKLNVRNFTIPYCAKLKKEQNSLLINLNKKYSKLLLTFEALWNFHSTALA